MNFKNISFKNLVGKLKFALKTNKRKLNEALEENSRMSKIASSAEVVTGLAHEFAAPIRRITQNVEFAEKYLLQQNPNIEKATEHLQKIHSSLIKMKKTVEIIKDEARNGVNDYYEFTSVQDIIAETKFLCENDILRHGVHFKINQFMEMQVMCRPTDIIQVLSNLVANSASAVSRLPYDQKWIELSVQFNDDYVFVEVTDGTEGLSEEQVNDVFKPYSAGEHSEGPRDLNLSLSQQIMLGIGGELYYNHKNVHTSFVVKFPIQQFESQNIA